MRRLAPLLVWTLAVLAACGSPVAATPEPSFEPSVGLGDPTAATGTPVVLSQPWLPPWSGPSTPVEIAERPLAPFCGVEEGTQVDRAVDRAVRGCFVDLATAGQAVEMARVAPTFEGDQIAIVYGYDPDQGFWILHDATQDKFGSGTWTLQRCQRIAADPDEVFTVEGCVDGGEFR